MHPIAVLQGALVAALRADEVLAAIVGAGVFDAPPPESRPPYVVIARHDLVPRDADLAPGHEHRLLIHCWSDQPSRRRVLEMVERVVAVALSCPVTGMVVTHRAHVRTETTVGHETGFARAAVTLRLLGEPA